MSTEQPKPQSMGCLVAPVAIIAYGVLGFLLLWSFGGQVLNFFSTMSWEQVSGTVISRSVEDISDTSGERYVPRIAYTYEVDGETYEGTQLDLRTEIFVGNEEDASELIAPYPVGAEVMPFVDTNDPTHSVMKREILTGVWWLVGIGSAFLVLSVGLGIRYVIVGRTSSEST